ncbi:MAG: hypothetical protein RML12_03225 [Xanthomonadales bacterium]|nr:hypothetical protein [Xanthomonadales bacterium]
MAALGLPPLALYAHLPWCLRKCPYCDFNSHRAPAAPPFDAYVEALLADLALDAELVQRAHAATRSSSAAARPACSRRRRSPA